MNLSMFVFLKTLFVICILIVPSGHSNAYDVSFPILSALDCDESAEGWEERAYARSINGVLGLPNIDHPIDNQPSLAKIRLGRKLFFDRRLSINKTMSCAMCHVPEQAFTNWELQTAVGVEGRSLKRNSPSLLNVGFYKVLFHDGRDKMLETQFVSPLIARNEMANPSVGLVIDLLQNLADYKNYFHQAFGGQASLDRVGMALGAYQRSLVAGNTLFDHWYYNKKDSALTESQKRGFKLFTGKANCGSCHLINDKHALFTDNLFHDTGYGWMRERKRQYPNEKVLVQVTPDLSFEISHAKVMSVGLPVEADLGRYEVTEKPEDRWKFRTSSLRNIAVTMPYMHDGGLPSLAEVINFYDSGGPGHPLQDKRIQPLNLSKKERDDLENFLESLTSLNLSCLVAEGRSHDPDNHEIDH